MREEKRQGYREMRRERRWSACVRGGVKRGKRYNGEIIRKGKGVEKDI